MAHPFSQADMVMEVSKEPTKPTGDARTGTHRHFMPVMCHANFIFSSDVQQPHLYWKV